MGFPFTILIRISTEWESAANGESAEKSDGTHQEETNFWYFRTCGQEEGAGETCAWGKNQGEETERKRREREEEMFLADNYYFLFLLLLFILLFPVRNVLELSS